MAQTPKKPILLGRDELKAKYEALGMSTYLKEHCKPKQTKRRSKQSYYLSQHREDFLRNDNQKSQAIIYWWRNQDGSEDYRVLEFTSPDGQLFAEDVIRHPSALPPDTTTI